MEIFNRSGKFTWVSLLLFHIVMLTSLLIEKKQTKKQKEDFFSFSQLGSFWFLFLKWIMPFYAEMI